MLQRIKNYIHQRYIDSPKQKRERIITLDLLRGLFLGVIFINHIAWSPSLFTFLTGSSHLAASAAEGFFTISGLLVGYIYGPKVLKNTKQTFFKLLKRAGWLYLLSIFFTILYTLMVLPVGPDYMRTYVDFNQQFTSIFDYLYKVFTFQFIFGWADFLARYSLFMLFAPLALWLVAKKQAWIVVIVSIATWLSLNSENTDLFRPWVIIFYVSILIGYYLPEIENQTRKVFTKKHSHIIGFLLLFSALATYLLSTAVTTVFPFILDSHTLILSQSMTDFMSNTVSVNQTLQNGVFSRELMGIGRLLIGILWFWSLYVIFRKYEQKIDSITRGSLFLLGTNSLYVYGLSSLIIILVDMLLPVINDRSIILNTVVTFNFILVLYFFTRNRTYMKKIRHKIMYKTEQSSI